MQQALIPIAAAAGLVALAGGAAALWMRSPELDQSKEDQGCSLPSEEGSVPVNAAMPLEMVTVDLYLTSLQTLHDNLVEIIHKNPDKWTRRRFWTLWTNKVGDILNDARNDGLPSEDIDTLVDASKKMWLSVKAELKPPQMGIM
jgi:hypothetical protein